MTRTLVTSALPYANGSIHFGQVIGAYLPADVYVRTLRMLGEEALFVCGTDEYGVAITFGAEKEGLSYSEYVARNRASITEVFDLLGIEFDVFSGTSTSPYHAELTQDFFRQLDANGYLVKKEGAQLFSPSQDRFLADRYVIGTCPKCEHGEARGDECPNCGSWLDPLELGDPRSKIDGEPLERRETLHWYLDMPKLRDAGVGDWIRDHEWKSNVKSFIHNLLADVPQRAITRDLDWGIPVPAEILGGAEGKVIYVWFDAPIGYISFTREWADAQGDPDAWKRWWQSPDTRLVHFIGKDNIPFHCMVFPAMLFGTQQGYVLPWQVPANEFYNLQGKKFSTSGGWGLPPKPFLERYDADTTRFYLLASAPETADSDFTWEDFQRTANSSLADTIGNLATRVLRFCAKHFDGRVPPLHADHIESLERALLSECGTPVDPADSIREFRFRRATEELISNAALANVFVDRTAPWALRKTDLELCGSTLNMCCEWLGWIARWMAPFMPSKAQSLWAMLGHTDAVAERGWPGLPQAGAWRMELGGQELGEVSGLFTKITDEDVARELAELEARAAH